MSAVADRAGPRPATALFAVLVVLAASCGTDTDDRQTSIDGVPATLGPSAAEDPSSSPPPTTATTPPPATTSTTSTAPPPTAAVTSPTTGDVVRPNGFAEWPVPTQPAPSLAELGYLLPPEPIAGADHVVRSDWDADVEPERVDHTQVFVASDGTSMLMVQSNPGQVAFTPEEFRSVVDVAGWDDAYFSRSAPGFANLTLVESGGNLVLNGRNMSEDVVLAAARSLRRRPGGAPGWEIAALPAGMFSIHEGWENGPSFRELDWYAGESRVAELTIAGGVPRLIDPGIGIEDGLTVTDVGGIDALAVEGRGVGGPPTSLITWSPQPEVVVYFGMRASIDEALSVARSLREVDRAAWEAAGDPPELPLDGCSSFRC